MKKSFLILFILCLSPLAYGQKNFEIPKGPPVSLIDETRTLLLSSEDSIQKSPPLNTLFISVLAGTLDLQFLEIQSHNKTIDYPFSKTLPLLTAQASHFFNQWGLMASVGYSYTEYEGTQKTSLHIIPVQLAAIYRAKFKTNQIFVPYGMLGPSLFSFYQRGLDEFNTSTSKVVGTATLGIAANLNHNETQLILQYQRNFSDQTNTSNLNGMALQAGGSIAF